ncbi:uncharacterized protein B0I36DRAFT_75625 [Microdochium trichocladiopsis]|uniref:Uncharacterized protein n=1 Tax=Microdochium trichocladiopsis TaxID=1682393 RepID=A0A9P8YHM2_9PEZI|nr:uncharacterized protein B0I36DRAFT_75625 [Microdochium trichocladiopsis]KAH7038109.1 hypothetical protein B0I36DRAFT_75625 [Microdochium trichocladiopsis]
MFSNVLYCVGLPLRLSHLAGSRGLPFGGTPQDQRSGMKFRSQPVQWQAHGLWPRNQRTRAAAHMLCATALLGRAIRHRSDASLNPTVVRQARQACAAVRASMSLSPPACNPRRGGPALFFLEGVGGRCLSLCLLIEFPLSVSFLLFWVYRGADIPETAAHGKDGWGKSLVAATSRLVRLGNSCRRRQETMAKPLRRDNKWGCANADRLAGNSQNNGFLSPADHPWDAGRACP